jgi:hypothetical protein
MISARRSRTHGLLRPWAGDSLGRQYLVCRSMSELATNVLYASHHPLLQAFGDVRR